jgi:hypothetical protein
VWTIGARAAFAHYAFTGISRHHLALLLAELRPRFTAAREGRLWARRRHERRRRAGAGRLPVLEFTDRVVVTLVYLRLAIPHEALAVVFGVDRTTITRAIGQIRPLLAARGFAVGDGVRLHTLADVFAYAAAEGITLRLDGTEVRVRRPRAHRPGRKAFISGKLKQNTIKGSVVSDAHGYTVWCGGFRPGRMHDATAIRTEGIDALLDCWPQVQVLVDAAYRGLANDHPDQVHPPPLRPPKTAPEAVHECWRQARKAQSSHRIPVEHAIAELKWWRQLQRYTGRRELLPETFTAIASLVSDRLITW